MKLIMDTCVLYPTALRGIMMQVAQAGVFAPHWSPMIEQELGAAYGRDYPEGRLEASAIMAQLNAAFPHALLPKPTGLERFDLPDAQDVHVLASAIDGGCNGIATLNTRDFPRGVLCGFKLELLTPDEVLVRTWAGDRSAVENAVHAQLALYRKQTGQHKTIKAFLKKAHLPRFARVMG